MGEMNQLTLEDYLRSARFEGPADNARDCDRLCGQILRVYDALYAGHWLTLNEIHQATGDPEASISAQLRHLRKHRFGGHDIRKRRRNDGNQWEYRLNGG
jgi:hypothetical protein